VDVGAQQAELDGEHSLSAGDRAEAVAEREHAAPMHGIHRIETARVLLEELEAAFEPLVREERIDAVPVVFQVVLFAPIVPVGEEGGHPDRVRTPIECRDTFFRVARFEPVVLAEPTEVLTASQA